MSIEQAAKILGVHSNTIRNYIKVGKLTAQKVNILGALKRWEVIQDEKFEQVKKEVQGDNIN